MKVHITLEPSVRSDPQAKQDALELIQRVVPLSNLNTRRFDRHGILSADVEPADVGALDHLKVVKSVSVDQVQRALVER